MTITETRPPATDSLCGPQLWQCRCRGTTPIRRADGAVELLHRAAVERARASGWDSVEERVRVLAEVGW